MSDWRDWLSFQSSQTDPSFSLLFFKAIIQLETLLLFDHHLLSAQSFLVRPLAMSSFLSLALFCRTWHTGMRIREMHHHHNFLRLSAWLAEDDALHSFAWNKLLPYFHPWSSVLSDPRHGYSLNYFRWKDHTNWNIWEMKRGNRGFILKETVSSHTHNR